MNRKTTIKN